MLRSPRAFSRNRFCELLISSGGSVVITMLVAFMFVCAGCSLNTGDANSPKTSRELALNQLKCVNPSFEVFKDYFKGTASAEAVTGAWDCFDGAVETFVSNTHGASKESYTAEELRTFFQIYYLNGRKISDGFLVDLMRLKQLLAGGNALILKKTELNTIRSTLKILKSESLRLRPFVLYFKMSVPIEAVQANPAPFKEALAALVFSSHQLSSIFSHSSIVYPTSEMESLLHNSSLFMENWDLPEKAIAYLPTFELAKSFIVGGSSDTISVPEFLPLLDRIGRLGAIQFRAYYLLTGVSPTRGPGLDQLEITLHDAFSLLSEIVKSKPGQVIEFEQAEQLVDEAARLNLLKPNFPRDSMKKAFRLIVQKMLVTPDSTNHERKDGIDAQTLKAIQTLLKTFIDRQRAWENVEDAAVRQGLISSGDSVSVKNALSLWPKFYQNPMPGQDSIMRLFSQEKPLTFSDSGAINFDRHAADQGLSESAFVKMNVISLFDRMVTASYGKSQDRSLTQTEFAQLFNDFFDLAVEFKLLEPKDKTLVKTSFDEANIFTLAARADGRLSELELFDYIAELESAALMSGRAYADIGESCRAVGVDYFNRPTYEAACVRRMQGSQFGKYFPELPEWVKIANGQSEGTSWSDLEVGLETAARDAGFSDAPISNSDLNRMAMVMQYIETLYVRFDHNHSGTIDFSEAKEALPLFAPMLRDASGFKSDQKILALFMYILAKGKAPTSIGEKLDFVVSWSRKPSKWLDVHADRFQFLTVIGSLAKRK